jgi:hypothetical protein
MDAITTELDFNLDLTRLSHAHDAALVHTARILIHVHILLWSG